MVMANNETPLSGRLLEKQTLERLLKSPRSEFLAVYGRRRVGKTFLIRRFFETQGLDIFEMTGRFQGTRGQHLQIFAEDLSEAYYGGAPLAPPANWHEAFRMLREAIEQTHGQRKFVLFFDELPWIASHRSGCLPALEHFWNAWCSKRNDLLLIVCGSAASWMLRKIVSARGGLHNRVTATMRLLPFSLAELESYAHDRRLSFTRRDLVELYLCFGGVPHYLDHLERGRSVAQHIDALCLHKDGALRQEFSRLFASLFSDDKKYRHVVRALASKRGGLPRGELLAAAGLRTGGGATTILTNLEEGGFITSMLPLDRADGVITVCEMKFTDGPFTISKSYAERLRRKLAVFHDVTGTKKALHLVFVTSYELDDNRYSRELIDQKISMDAMFRS